MRRILVYMSDRSKSERAAHRFSGVTGGVVGASMPRKGRKGGTPEISAAVFLAGAT